MKKHAIKIIVGIILTNLIITACGGKQTAKKNSRVSALPYYNEATFTPNWVSANSDSLNGFHQVPSFSLTNQDGELVTEKTFNNKIYVTNFFFTSCPGICPKMTNNMLLVQEAFATDNDVLLLSHSVTPEFDSVPILKKYATKNKIKSNKWHLVTGEREVLYQLGRQAYFIEEDLGLVKSDEDFLHTENFILIDKNKHIRGIYNGLNKTSVKQLIADIKTLKEE